MTIMLLGIAVIAVLAIAGYTYERISIARVAKRYPPPGRLVDVDGRKVHVIRKGTGGPTVVFESSSATSSQVWWAIQDELAKTTTVFAYDRAGLGWSDPAKLPRSLEERARELNTILTRAGVVPPYVLVGYSFGGMLIRRFASEHRDEVAGMVFVDAAHETLPASHFKRTARGLSLLGGLSQTGLTRLLRIKLTAYLRVRPPQGLNAIQQELMRNRPMISQEYAVGADENLSMIDAAAALSRVSAPLSLHNVPISAITHGVAIPGSGAGEEQAWQAAQLKLAALSSIGEVIVARESGHLVPQEEPELVLNCIQNVITAVRNTK